MIDNENLESQVEQVETQVQPEQQTIQEKPKIETKSVEDHKNFKSLRDKAEKAERERDELLRKFQEIEAAKIQQPQEDDEIRIGPDDIAEGKHLSKVQQKIRKLEQQIKNYEQKTAEVTIESKIKAQYPDFDKIVSPENIEQLRNNYPELAQALNSSSDLYSKAVSAYQVIKKLGIAPDITFDVERQKIQENATKPRSLASVSPQQGDSPLSRANAFANGLTDELKTQLRKEMEAARRNH